MNITIYGPEGCSNCTQLKEKTQAVVDEQGVDAEVTKEGDAAKLAAKGFISPPGFEIDDEIVFTGSTPSKEELVEIIDDWA